MGQQTERRFGFHSPLGDALRFIEMRGAEQLGRTFAFTVHLLSRDPQIKLSDLLGRAVSVSVDLAPNSSETRFFHGIVTRFQREGKHGNDYLYSAHLVPWLWLLSYTANCRIFQNLSVPDIVKTVFRQHKLSDFADSLVGAYEPREYVTQYDETDLEFVSRLMEDEGIYYFFKHEETKHTLVLADSPSAHAKVPGFEEVLLFGPTHDQSQDHIDRWSMWNELQSGGVALSDFDFENPRGDLLTKCVAPNAHAQADHEVYWHPGGHTNYAAGEDRCRLRLEELNARYEQMGGSGNVRGLGTGDVFDFVDPRSGGAKHEYLIDFASYDLRGGGYESGAGHHAESHFHFEFSALDRQRQFRPERRFNPKRMFGPQTATVVGDKDQDITTDTYGRVKVKFHWDRKKGNEQNPNDIDKKGNDPNSSCWVRVAQMWAGAHFGAINIPRIGEEVIVDFLEGDPDRPIITGRVYNADNMPPYTLPEHKTQSGIKTRSSKGGTEANFNELRFEDKKGHEELHIQAERNMSTLVKRDQSLTVQADRKVTVHGNETIEVTGTRDTKINNKETQTFNFDRKMTVEGANTDDIKGAHTGIYYGGRTQVVETGDTLLVVGSHKTTTVEGEYNVVANEHYSVTSGGKSTCSVDLKEGVATITAANEINLVCGDASLSLKSDGTVTIQGKKTLSATGAESKLELASAGAKLSGANAVVDLSGGMVKLDG
jgi:type VI secretion system secreted protein VgrG